MINVEVDLLPWDGKGGGVFAKGLKTSPVGGHLDLGHS